MKNTTAPNYHDHNDHPRNRIINSYLATIEKSIREDRPQIKLINFGTGSGKTHQLFQAICETIQNKPDRQFTGVYVAPLREHLQVPSEVREKYPKIPIYTIHSLDMKTTDDLIKSYKKWIQVILRNKEFWGSASSRQEKVQEAKQNLHNTKNVISRLEFLKKSDFGGGDFQEIETKKTIRELNNLIEKFLEFFIKCNLNEIDWPNECMKLVEIFYPVHLLREKSGILLLTYDKFETLIQYFTRNSSTWVKKNDYLDAYILKHSNNVRKFILAFDEQEDGYQIMLKHKIDIISPQELAINNALSSVNREFSALFTDEKEAQDFFYFMEKNPGAFHELQEHIEKGKIVDPKLEKIVPTYQWLTAEAGNSVIFLQKVLELHKGIRKAFDEIAGTLENYDEKDPVVLNFDVLANVFSKFQNNRGLLIPQSLYSRIGDDLMNIFAYNNLYIYDIEPLKKLFLTRAPGGHVQITEHEGDGNPSVAELIYAILAIRLQIKLIKEILAKVLDAKDSQSHSLDIWSQQIDKAQKSGDENAIPNSPIKYLNRAYVYQSNKSIINIKEISRYQFPSNNLIDQSFREVSIGSTAIITSPEHRILSMLSANSNVIFLISATGGIFGDLTTSYDMHYLQDSLRDPMGKSSFETMNEDEVKLSQEIRNYRQLDRNVTTSFFSSDQDSRPNLKTHEVLDIFEKQILKEFIETRGENNGWSGLGIYKVQELRNFVAFLFHLFEDDDIQQTIAFTQTLRWIKQLVGECAKLHHGQFLFEPSPDHPNIYFVQLRHPKYHSVLKVKIILYESSFNNQYNNKITQKTYLDELSQNDGEKILFVSAYQSASKGLNPVIRTQEGSSKDFDSIVLLMDSYYTVMGPTLYKAKDSGKDVTIFHFSLMKSIVRLGDSMLEVKDFNGYLSQPEARDFQEQQHQILLGKGILQAIGRTERRDHPNQVIKIFINEETRNNLVNFYRYLAKEESNELHKLSVNNYAVHLSVLDDERKRTIQNYDAHIYDETEAYLTFQNYRKRMLNEIGTFHLDHTAIGITRTWNALRDPLAFKDPEQYLEKLRSSRLFPDEFIESLFYYNPSQPKFAPYLAMVEENGKKFQLLSDSVNGEKAYPYLSRLFPEYMRGYSRGYDLEGNEVVSLNETTDIIYQQYKQLVPDPEMFIRYIPRPQFFYDVLYPSLAENFTERWIHNVVFEGRDWKSIKTMYGFEPIQDFTKYHRLFELFDLFYIKGNTLFCIDVKAWSQVAGNRLSKKTLDKAHDKLETIAANYPEFSKVKGLLLNLHALEEKNHQYPPALASGNLIYFDDYRFPVESNILRSFLFQKES